MRAIRHILVGTDFSRPATRAVARAALLAAEHAAALTILHVAPRGDRAALRRLGLALAWGAEPGAQASRQLQLALELARSLAAAATARVVTGTPVGTLGEEAKRLDADLVVVGCRGERSLRDVFLGTTAERLMESWPRDLLLVKQPARHAYRKAMACVALAPDSIAVLRSALAWVGPAPLHVLHVYEVPLARKLVSHGVSPAVLKDYRGSTREAAAQGLAELLARCSPPPGRLAHQHLRQGYPPRVITSTAVRLGADLVVIGKNQSLTRALFLGSTTKHVVREATADVLLAAPRYSPRSSP